MNTDTQQIIIIILGILGIASIITGNNTTIDVIIAGLIGFLSQKTLTEKQQEIIQETIQQEEENVQ